MRGFLRLNATPLSPLIVFCGAWALTALLCQLQILNAQTSWSTVMVAVVLVVPLAFLAGGLLGESVAIRASPTVAETAAPAPATRVFRIVLTAFLVIGLLELAHQFAKIGGIPLLSPNGNVLRFQQGGATIVLTDLLTVAAIAALVRPENLLARESRFELMVALIALGGFALQAGRGSVVLPIIVATVGRWLYWGRPKMWTISGAGLMAFLVIVFGFYLRTRQNPYNPFEAEFYGEVIPSTPLLLQPLLPVYIALTTNFVALQGIVGAFPTVIPFGGGVYDALAFNSVITGAKDVGEVSAGLTPPWVTSTIAGSFWADGGFWVVIPGVALTGFLSAGAFVMAARTRSLRWSMVAAYLLYLVIFGLYSNLWTQTLDWLIVTPLLLAVGAFVEDAERPPGVTGWAWVRIRSVTRSGTAQVKAPATAAPEMGPGDDRPGRGGRRLARTLALAGFGVLVVLLVSGWAIQRLLPEPFPLIESRPLPAASADARQAITSSDFGSSDNKPVYWATVDGERVELARFEPAFDRVRSVHSSRIPGIDAETTFDIGSWPPWRNQALFSFTQGPSRLAVTVTPTAGDPDRARTFRAPIAPPAEGSINTFMIATWDGPKPDLFIVTRGSEKSRAILRILSGESGFQRQLLLTRLPFRGLGPEEWALDAGLLASLGKDNVNRTHSGERPDLLLVHHDPDREHSSVEVLLGETGFTWDAYTRDLDTPGDLPAGTEFMLGTRLGASAVYEVGRHDPDGPRLQVFGLENPPQFR
ncbi:MAG: O-antigen polymerase [Solirubrobacterales bacterium]